MDYNEVDNYAKAFALLQMSSAADNASGMCSLGYMYEKGTGVKQDEKEAAQWYEKAAKQGFIQAQEKLKK